MLKHLYVDIKSSLLDRTIFQAIYIYITEFFDRQGFSKSSNLLRLILLPPYLISTLIKPYISFNLSVKCKPCLRKAPLIAMDGELWSISLRALKWKWLHILTILCYLISTFIALWKKHYWHIFRCVIIYYQTWLVIAYIIFL